MSTKPNVLVIMSDQHSPTTLGSLGHPCVKTPHLDALAARGVTFTQAYCPYPLCAPSRASFMTGLNAPQHDVWELGTPLYSAIPTWSHALRSAGYVTSIAGRMHFMGPDQMHGYERRVYKDGYVGKSPWAYDPWLQPIEDEHVMLGAIEQAGPTSELTVNEKTDLNTHAAAMDELTWLTDHRKETNQPWALTVGLIQPHFPFKVSQKWWDMYEGVDIDMPVPPPQGKTYEQLIPPQMQGSRKWLGLSDDGLTVEQIKSARRTYYGMITQIDDYIGKLIAHLDATGQLENTIILYTSDHGDNMGSHGLWSKLNFYQDSVSMPFIVAGPNITHNKTCTAPISLVDWLPTMLGIDQVNDSTATTQDLATSPAWPTPLAGHSLWPLLKEPSQTWDDRVVVSDYACGGTRVPLRMVRRGSFKACFGPPLPPVLFNLQDDPNEFVDLSGDPAHADLLADLYQAAQYDGWNPDTLLPHIQKQKRALHFIQNAEAKTVASSNSAATL